MALVSALARQSVLAGQGGSDQLLVVLALLGIAGFVVWLLFFSGNGTFRDFLQDMKSSVDRKPKDPFPVPQFDKSKLVVPLPPKPARKPLTFHRTADEIDLKLDTWAKDLRTSLREVRAESEWLVEKYKDVPLKREKPAVSKKPAKKATTQKPTAKKTVKKTTTKKTTSKKTTTQAKTAAKKAAKKTTSSAKPKASR